MNIPETSLIDILIGAIVLGLGLLYLTAQYHCVLSLTNITNDRMITDDKVNQQFNDEDITIISDAELSAIVMGYRDFPISIDGTVFSADDTDHNSIMTLIRPGYYKKSYTKDDKNNILQISYTYKGTGIS